MNVDLPELAWLPLERRSVLASRLVQAIEVEFPDVTAQLGGGIGVPLLSAGDLARVAAVDRWVKVNALRFA